MTIRGRTHIVRLCAFLMKCASIFSVTSKSAITPSFMGLMATMLPGVRPSISLASLPTASTSPLFLLMATMEGSLTTMPLPRAYTRVFAVPRSMARSLENMLARERILLNQEPFLWKPLDDDIRCSLQDLGPRAGEENRRWRLFRSPGAHRSPQHSLLWILWEVAV